MGWAGEDRPPGHATEAADQARSWGPSSGAAPQIARSRLASVDVLRGLVMILMALDHVRDYFSGADFSPEDLAHTTPAYFFTRWITHFCAPSFFFLAGVSVFLSRGRRTRRSLAAFLITRGLWLMVAELTIVRLAWSFELGAPLRFMVIWTLGASMLVLVAALYLPRWAIAIGSLVLIAGHNLLDGIPVARLIGPEMVSLHASTFDWIWSFLHVQNFPVLYPLIPWAGVMAAGYAFAPLLEGEPAARRRRLTRLGLAIIAGFVVLRAVNGYGNPAPWGSPHAVLSFLNLTKYPPSLLFLMMTLGPAIVALPRLEGIAAARVGGVIATYGRVPFFFYVLHLYVIHGLSLLAPLIAPGPAAHGGFDLWVVYVVWGIVVASLYPVCRWFAGVKARRRDAWLSYL
jgi:uncharacterized membrane protein